MLIDSYRHKGMRAALIEELKKKGVHDESVLRAIYQVPRHFFMDSAFLEHAYQDKAFNIGEGQTISQPSTVALQTGLLDIKTGDKVLEIGTGSGFQACVLARMGAEVYSLEYNKTLHVKAKKIIEEMGLQIQLFHGDGSLGLPAHAPFDKIIVTAGCPSVPSELMDQLKINGILVIPVGDSLSQKMLKFEKITATKIKREEAGDFSFVPLRGQKGWFL